MSGIDCSANVLYRCRLIGVPLPEIICPNGCAQDRCLTKIVSVGEDLEEDTERNSTNSKEVDTLTDPNEREVEFVTFAPMVHLSHFP